EVLAQWPSLGLAESPELFLHLFMRRLGHDRYVSRRPQVANERRLVARVHVACKLFSHGILLWLYHAGAVLVNKANGHVRIVLDVRGKHDVIKRESFTQYGYSRVARQGPPNLDDLRFPGNRVPPDHVGESRSPGSQFSRPETYLITNIRKTTRNQVPNNLLRLGPSYRVTQPTTRIGYKTLRLFNL